ncbi:MAG: hypothetical protein QXS02_04190 [Candidatus Thermoplasmatota archaeon]
MIEAEKKETQLIPKVSPTPKVCMYCHSTIPANEVYHQEEGVGYHLHSLVARHFCSKCYAKYGAKQLLKGEQK